MKSNSSRPKQAAGTAKKSSAEPKAANAGKKQEQSAEATSLKKLYEEGLKDIYNAEKQLLKALPKMAKAATSEELVNAFEEHLAVTEGQVARLEEVFAASGLKVGSKKCAAMEGLVKEGEEAVEETEDGSTVRDVALIMAAQKVEHYEMASYGTLRSIATVLGFDEAADLLQETLDEEGEADKTLTGIAVEVNIEAQDEE